jgi:hypothetical protein
LTVKVKVKVKVNFTPEQAEGPEVQFYFFLNLGVR